MPMFLGLYRVLRELPGANIFFNLVFSQEKVKAMLTAVVHVVGNFLLRFVDQRAFSNAHGALPFPVRKVELD